MFLDIIYHLVFIRTLSCLYCDITPESWNSEVSRDVYCYAAVS
jgi:hypothetical protein